MGRKDDERPTIGDAISAVRRAEKKYCLHPNASTQACSGKIIKAHTIQRNGRLSQIARDGHVYQFVADIPTLAKGDDSFGPDLVGLRKATTFTGFCNKHDTEIFRPIETAPLQPTQEHAFLLSYRSISRELYAKQAQYDMTESMKQGDKGLGVAEQYAFQQFVETYRVGVQAGLDDLQHRKSEMDAVLVSGDYSGVRFYSIRLDTAPDFMCSGSLLIEMDFAGNKLQGLDEFAELDNRLEYCSFSLIGTDAGGAAVFSWLGDSPIATQFVESLAALDDEQVPHALTRFTFEFFENVAISPDWWDQLPDDDKAAIHERKRSGVDMEQERESDVLVDDGHRMVSWAVTGRHSNVVSHT